MKNTNDSIYRKAKNQETNKDHGHKLLPEPPPKFKIFYRSGVYYKDFSEQWDQTPRLPRWENEAEKENARPTLAPVKSKSPLPPQPLFLERSTLKSINSYNDKPILPVFNLTSFPPEQNDEFLNCYPKKIPIQTKPIEVSTGQQISPKTDRTPDSGQFYFNELTCKVTERNASVSSGSGVGTPTSESSNQSLKRSCFQDELVSQIVPRSQAMDAADSNSKSSNSGLDNNILNQTSTAALIVIEAIPGGPPPPPPFPPEDLGPTVSLLMSSKVSRPSKTITSQKTSKSFEYQEELAKKLAARRAVIYLASEDSDSSSDKKTKSTASSRITPTDTTPKVIQVNLSGPPSPPPPPSDYYITPIIPISLSTNSSPTSQSSSPIHTHKMNFQAELLKRMAAIAARRKTREHSFCTEKTSLRKIPYSMAEGNQTDESVNFTEYFLKSKHFNDAIMKFRVPDTPEGTESQRPDSNGEKLQFLSKKVDKS